MEVLLQFREFKRPLSIIPSEACKTIAGELRSMGVEDAVVTVASDDRKVEKGTFLLQKWSTRQVLETGVCVVCPWHVLVHCIGIGHYSYSLINVLSK